MSVAHDTITGGHLGIKKTREKIMSNLLAWHVRGRGQILPLVRYMSEDGEQGKTVQKASMENIPVVDVPFKLVAVDLIGPIEAVSEAG